MRISEIITEKASRALCVGGKPDAELGASNLASCKSQGFRARDGEKSHLIGHSGSKVRITVGGKKIKGKKRHILVDTQGLLLHAVVHSADIQDRDGGVLVMATLFGAYPFLRKLYADGGYQGPQFRNGLRRVNNQIDVEIVKRSDQVRGFSVLPKRWLVERTIAWLNRCRRLAKDWECRNRSALAFLQWASIRCMLRKLCQSGG